MYILIITIIWFLIIFSILIFLLKIKIEKLENKIIILFNKKNSLIPCIYEISKWNFIKHEQIFDEILKLMKINFQENNIGNKLFEIIKTQILIHNELNFIFKIFAKYPKLYKDEKFLYINELYLENNLILSSKISIYKEIIKKYNQLINIKNITILWLFIPFNKKNNL